MVEPEEGDRRFRDQAWSENAVFDFIKQSYLLDVALAADTVEGRARGPRRKTRQKVDFYTRQFVDALAPSNFVATNPEVLRATIETSGENLLQGLNNLLDDLERGKGKLAITMTDLEAFKIGENLALTPGKVVFQNELMQLIQYAPTTEQVYKRPLLIIPALDQQVLHPRPAAEELLHQVRGRPGLHGVRDLLGQPRRASSAHKTFEDYMVEGPLAALDAMSEATGEREATVIGYCLGGTLLAATLAYWPPSATDRIKAATFFATLVDFAEGRASSACSSTRSSSPRWTR